MKKHFLITLFTVASFGLFTAGCSHESGADYYHEGEWPKVGYSDKVMSDGEVSITVSFGSTRDGIHEPQETISESMVQDFLMLRAAELCLKSGNRSFTKSGSGELSNNGGKWTSTDGDGKKTSGAVGSYKMNRTIYVKFYAALAVADSYNAAEVYSEIKKKRSIS